MGLVTEFRRWRKDQCDHCGERFRWRAARNSFGNRDGKVWHNACIAYLTWRTKADERLAVLALTLDVAGVTDRDIKGAAELRAETDIERVKAGNRAFRVFYDLSKQPTP